MIDLRHIDPDLSLLDDDGFKAVVNADIRRRSRVQMVEMHEDVSKALRSPEYIDRWYATLQLMATSVHTQFDNLESRLELKEIERSLQRRRLSDDAALRALAIESEENRAEFLRKKVQAQKFADFLAKTMYEAERLRGDHVDARVRRLQEAIQQHRESVSDNPTIDPASADLALWEVLNT